MVKQAKKLCLLGATDKQLAEFFEVHVSNIDAWKNTHPEFGEALRRGKEGADAVVAQSLYHRAKGYKHIAFKMFQNDGVVLTKRYVEHFAPDTTACIFWLKNRRPDLWRDRHELTGANGGPVETLDVSKIEAARAIAFMLEEGRQAVLRAQKSGNAAGKKETA